MVVAICFANSCSTYTHTYIYTVRWTNTLNKPTDWRKTLKYPTHKSPQTYTCNGQYTNTSTSSIVLSTWIMCHCPHRKHEQLVKPSSMTEFLGIQRLYIYIVVSIGFIAAIYTCVHQSVELWAMWRRHGRRKQGSHCPVKQHQNNEQNNYKVSGVRHVLRAIEHGPKMTTPNSIVHTAIVDFM